MEVNDILRNNILYKEGDKPEYLYFIYKGDVELIKKC